MSAFRGRLSLWLGLSLLLHLVGFVVAESVLRVPALDIEFELPMDVELGTEEALTPAAPPEAVAPAPSAATAQGPQERDRRHGASDAGSDAAQVDGGLANAGVAVARPRARDAGASVPSVHADAGAATRLPPGAQIALRVDMARIRQSPLAGDVRALLAAVPDWQALLEGSGIDPVEQLDRLLIATPNLQREKVVLAGRYLGGEQVVREAVSRLGEARGEPTAWRREGNVQVAPWANADATKRVIALVGPAHFAIARPEDLPRILAISTARAARKGARRDPLHPADALLSMEEGEGLSLEVEGAAQFVRRARRGIPERLRVSASELPGARLALHGVFTYVDDARARDAADYWGALRDTYASNTLVVLLGLADPLEEARIDSSAREVRISLELSAAQTRLVLGYVRELLAPPAPPPPRGP